MNIKTLYTPIWGACKWQPIILRLNPLLDRIRFVSSPTLLSNEHMTIIRPNYMIKFLEDASSGHIRRKQMSSEFLKNY